MTGKTAAKEFWVDEASLARSRWLFKLLMINWLGLGLIVIFVGSQNRLIEGLSLALGLLSMAIALGQRVAVKNAGTKPIARISKAGLDVRPYTSSKTESLAWNEVQRVEDQTDSLLVHRKDGRKARVTLNVLAPPQRDSLRQEVGRYKRLE